jgi:hypothetical protein
MGKVIVVRMWHIEYIYGGFLKYNTKWYGKQDINVELARKSSKEYAHF